jgi:hypothetical protein
VHREHRKADESTCGHCGPVLGARLDQAAGNKPEWRDDILGENEDAIPMSQ